MKDFAKIYKDAWRIVMSCPLLWGVAIPIGVLTALTSLVRESRTISYLTCLLSPIYLFAVFFELVSFPYIVARNALGDTCTLQEAWITLRTSLLRYVGFFFILGFLMIIPFIIAYNVLYIHQANKFTFDTWQSVLIALSLYYIGIPIIFAIFRFSISGLVIHKVNAFKAFINSILIIIDNPLLVLVSAFISMLIFPIIQTILLAIIGDSLSFRDIFITSKSFQTMNQYLLFINYVLSIFPSTYISIVFIQIYLNAQKRIRYYGVSDTSSLLTPEK